MNEIVRAWRGNLNAVSTFDLLSSISARDARLIAAWRREERPMAELPDKAQALIDVTRILASVAAPHALIGGVAVGIHAGIPRATQDTDLAVATTVDRGSLSRTLVDAGFQLMGEHAHSVNFRHRSGEPVQLSFDPEFDAMIARAEHFDVTGNSIAIVRKDDLIAMKQRAAADPSGRASKRLRDLADVELLRGDVPAPDEGW